MRVELTIPSTKQSVETPIHLSRIRIGHIVIYTSAQCLGLPYNRGFKTVVCGLRGVPKDAAEVLESLLKIIISNTGL